jgi:hypothetical protein
VQQHQNVVQRLTYGRRQSETDYFLTLKIAWYLVMSIIAMPNWCTAIAQGVEIFSETFLILHTSASTFDFQISLGWRKVFMNFS